MLKQMIALSVMTVAAFAVSAQPVMQTQQGSEPTAPKSDVITPASSSPMMQTQKAPDGKPVKAMGEKQKPEHQSKKVDSAKNEKEKKLSN